MAKNIKFLVMDVDGTLTDGKIYMGNTGELFKAFDIKDGYGICEILPANEIIPVIITARESQILENRCKELNITELYQGAGDKAGKLCDILNEYSKKDDKLYSFSEVAYIGDDVLDLQCMKLVSEAGGVAGCPADAIEAVKKVSGFISSKNGGNGAVREFIEWLTK